MQALTKVLGGVTSRLPTTSVAMLRFRTTLLTGLFPIFSTSQVKRERFGLPGSKASAVWFTPLASQPNDFYILHVHGGGFVTGSVDLFDPFICHLALQINAPIISVEYTLGPELPYPGQIDQFAQAYQWLLEDKGIPANKITLMGDSAGGNIVLSVLWRHAEKFKNKTPRSIVAICPVVDLTSAHINPTVTHNPAAEFFDPILTKHRYNVYFNILGMQDPQEMRSLSVAFASDFSFLPEKVLIQSSYNELLYPETKEFVERVNKRAGKLAIRFEEYYGMPHDFPLLVRFVSEARQAVGSIADFVRQANLS